MMRSFVCYQVLGLLFLASSAAAATISAEIAIADPSEANSIIRSQINKNKYVAFQNANSVGYWKGGGSTGRISDPRMLATYDFTNGPMQANFILTDNNVLYFLAVSSIVKSQVMILNVFAFDLDTETLFVSDPLVQSDSNPLIYPLMLANESGQIVIMSSESSGTTTTIRLMNFYKNSGTFSPLSQPVVSSSSTMYIRPNMFDIAGEGPALKIYYQTGPVPGQELVNKIIEFPSGSTIAAFESPVWPQLFRANGTGGFLISYSENQNTYLSEFSGPIGTINQNAGGLGRVIYKNSNYGANTNFRLSRGNNPLMSDYLAFWNGGILSNGAGSNSKVLSPGDLIKYTSVGGGAFKVGRIENVPEVSSNGYYFAVIFELDGSRRGIVFREGGCKPIDLPRVSQGNPNLYSNFVFGEDSSLQAFEEPGEACVNLNSPDCPRMGMKGCTVAAYINAMFHFLGIPKSSPLFSPTSQSLFDFWDSYRKSLFTAEAERDFPSKRNMPNGFATADFLNTRGGFEGNDKVEFLISNPLESDPVFNDLTYKRKIQYIKNYVCSGVPVAIRTNTAGGVESNDLTFGHTVLVTGTRIERNYLTQQEQEVLIVNDPKSQPLLTLNNETYRNNIRGVRPLGPTKTFGIKRKSRLTVSSAGISSIELFESPRRKLDETGPMVIFHNESVSSDSLESDQIFDSDNYAGNLYVLEPSSGEFAFKLGGVGGGHHKTLITILSEGGKLIGMKRIEGNLSAKGEATASFFVPASEPVSGSLQNLILDLTYSGIENNDQFIFRGKLLGGSNSNGFSLPSDPFIFDYPQMNAYLEVPAGGFQRISGGYRYQVSTTTPGIKLVRIMDNGDFEVRGRYLNLTGVSKENLGSALMIIGDDVLSGSPPSIPVLEMSAPETANLGATLNFTASSNLPAGQTANYSWELFSKPLLSTAQLASLNGGNTSLIADKAGRYVVKLSGTYNGMTSVPVLKTVVVSSEDSPSVPSPENGIIRITSDSPSYTVGQTGVINISVIAPPTNGANEVILKASFNGSPVVVTKVSETEFTYTTAALGQVGENVFEVDTFMQNRASARQIERAITELEHDKAKLEAELENETDSSRRQKIEEELALVVGNITKAQGELEAGRTRLGTRSELRFQVSSAR